MLRTALHLQAAHGAALTSCPAPPSPALKLARRSGPEPLGNLTPWLPLPLEEAVPLGRPGRLLVLHGLCEEHVEAAW